MNETLCKGTKPVRGYGRVPCMKKATKDGFCGIHHPDAVARREEAYRGRMKQWLGERETA